MVEWTLDAGGTLLQGFLRGPGTYATEPGTEPPSIVLQLTGNTGEAFGGATPVVTITLVDAFPHALPGLDALLVSGLAVQVDDGVTDPSTLSIGIPLAIGDDIPEIGTPDAGETSDAALPAGTSPDEAATIATGSLGIVWGADDADVADTEGQDAPGGVGDRSVVFAALAEQPEPPTSDGDDLEYVLLAGDTVLEARKVGTDEAVFRVSLSDDAAGSYTFEQLGNIDHADHFRASTGA